MITHKVSHLYNFLNESMFLNKPIEWMIQWLTHKVSQLFNSLIESVFERSVTCLIFLNESMFLNKSVVW